MSACWKALAAEPDIDLHVIAYAPNPGATHVHFDPALLDGLSHDLLDVPQRNDRQAIADRVAGFQPDVVIVPGWLHPPFRQLTKEPRLQNAAFVMAMDTSWRGTLRQHIARYALNGFLKQIDCVMVCGERAWQYARRLGFSEDRIFQGNYGFDMEAHSAAADARDHNNWPRRFIFVGRYVAAKGLDTLLAGYQQYRNTVSDPWSLTCCGDGPLREQLSQSEGVENRGFVQPKDLPQIFAEHGAFVLTSEYEPWGVVLAEAAAAGLPIVCTPACGASVELVFPFYNGLIIPTKDPVALCQALLWMHENVEELPQMGQRGRAYAAAYSPAIWVQRWKATFQRSLTQR